MTSADFSHGPQISDFKVQSQGHIKGQNFYKFAGEINGRKVTVEIQTTEKKLSEGMVKHILQKSIGDHLRSNDKTPIKLKSNDYQSMKITVYSQNRETAKTLFDSSSKTLDVSRRALNFLKNAIGEAYSIIHHKVNDATQKKEVTPAITSGTEKPQTPRQWRNNQLKVLNEYLDPANKNTKMALKIVDGNFVLAKGKLTNEEKKELLKHILNFLTNNVNAGFYTYENMKETENKEVLAQAYREIGANGGAIRHLLDNEKLPFKSMLAANPELAAKRQALEEQVFGFIPKELYQQ